MLIVECFTGKSEIAGTGLFPYYNITKGEPIWIKQNSDIAINMDSIPIEYRDYFDKYASVREIAGKLHYELDGDDCKYMNHSENPNVLFVTPELGIAIKDISSNEEITCDYRTITTPEHFQYLMSI